MPLSRRAALGWILCVQVAFAKTALEPGEEEEVVEDNTKETSRVSDSAARVRTGDEDQRKTLFLHVFSADDLPTDLLILAKTALPPVLEDRGYSVDDEDSFYLRSSIVKREIEAADQKLLEARKALDQLELETALDLVRSIVGAYETHLPVLLARDSNPSKLVEAYYLAAMARFLDGDNAAATGQFRHALMLEPSQEFDRRFPPDMRLLFDQARKDLSSAGTSALYVEQGAASARVLVDGRLVGQSPLRVGGLAVGPHYVTLQASGYKPWTTLVEVMPGRTSQVEPQLEGFRGEPFASLVDAQVDAVTGRMTETVLRAGKAVGRPDYVLFVRARRVAGRVRMSGFFYDIAKGKFVSGGESQGSLEHMGVVASELVLALHAQPKIIPVVQVAVERSSSWKPYLWPVVGVTAALAIGIGFAAWREDSRQEAGHVVVFGMPF